MRMAIWAKTRFEWYPCLTGFDRDVLLFDHRVVVECVKFTCGLAHPVDQSLMGSAFTTHNSNSTSRMFQMGFRQSPPDSLATWFTPS